MALHAVQLRGKISDVRDLNFARLQSRDLQATEDGLRDHGHDVLVFLAPVAGEVGLVSAENVNRGSHRHLLFPYVL